MLCEIFNQCHKNTFKSHGSKEIYVLVFQCFARANIAANINNEFVSHVLYILGRTDNIIVVAVFTEDYLIMFQMYSKTLIRMSH